MFPELPCDRTALAIFGFGGGGFSGSGMKRFAIAAVTIVAVVALFMAALPFIIPGSFLREMVASNISSWTGRAVTVEGEPRLSVYPELAITVDKMTIANPGDMGEAFIAADGVRASMRVLPLLTGRVEFKEFELVRPRFRFVVLKDGSRNWDISDGSIAQLAMRSVEEIAAAATSGAAASPQAAGVRLGRASVVDGTILYDDLAADRREEMTDLDLEMIWPTAGEPASGNGTLVWRGEPVQFSGSVHDPLALIAGKASAVRLTLAASTMRASFVGEARLAGQPRLSGDATLSTPSLRRALTWLGGPMEPAATLDAASISGTATLSGPGVTFEQATMHLDGNQATGSLTFALGDDRPVVRGKIAAERLDLTAYLEAARADIAASGPWLIAPTRLPFADALDADIDFSTAQLTAGPARLGDISGRLRVNAGSVDLTVDGAQFYGGTLAGNARAAMIGEEFVFDLDAEVSGVPARVALTDIAGVDGLDGTGAATLKIGGRGKTWGEFARSLTGNSAVTLAGGSIAQDLPAIAAAMSDPLAGEIEPEGGTTPFSALAATLAISGGILTTGDLAMKGPTAAVTLSGTGSVVTGLVDATARVVSGSDDVAVNVSGGWRRPVITRQSPSPPSATGAEAAISPPTGG